MTFRELYDALGKGNQAVEDDYFSQRASKVAELAHDIECHLIFPELALEIAEEIFSRSEEVGRINGDRVDGELPSSYTRDGQPRYTCV